MKTFVFAAALSVSSLAVAQTTPQTPPDTMQAPDPVPPADVDQPETPGEQQPTTQIPMPDQPEPAVPSGVTTDDGTVPNDGITQQGTDPAGTATPPPGTNQMTMPPPGSAVTPAPNQSDAFTPRPATTDYPPCSKTVTDSCVQTYERGSRPRG